MHFVVVDTHRFVKLAGIFIVVVVIYLIIYLLFILFIIV